MAPLSWQLLETLPGPPDFIVLVDVQGKFRDARGGRRPTARHAGAAAGGVATECWLVAAFQTRAA